MIAAILAFINRYALPFVAGGTALTVAGIGLWLHGLVIDATVARYELANAKAQSQALEASDALAARISAIDGQRTKELSDAREKINALAADVAAGRKRLRFASRCPKPAPVAAGSSVGDGPGPELDDVSGQAYFALRDGIETVTAQLAACQDILRSERE